MNDENQARRETISVLSHSAYVTGLYVYVGAGLAFVAYLAWYLSRFCRPATVAFWVLLSAVLLLTPAYPNAGIDTLAPALVVAGFQFFTQGQEGAMHALRPLAALCLVAIVVAVLLRFTLFRRRSGKAAAQAKNKAQAA
ncbi:MAG: hypothetical protein AAGF57_20190 [Pseudomonadota bacterium]